MTANLRRRKRRIRPDVLHALMSAATRQLLNEPADSPSRKPSLAQLHFMEREAPDDKQRAAAAADRRTP
jgi:hypothetical protein